MRKLVAENSDGRTDTTKEARWKSVSECHPNRHSIKEVMNSIPNQDHPCHTLPLARFSLYNMWVSVCYSFSVFKGPTFTNMAIPLVTICAFTINVDLLAREDIELYLLIYLTVLKPIRVSGTVLAWKWFGDSKPSRLKSISTGHDSKFKMTDQWGKHWCIN